MNQELFEQLPPEIPLPSMTQACSWAGISTKTQDRWVKAGLVRRITGGADAGAALELILVGHIDRVLGTEATAMLWPAIEPEILGRGTIPERLDLVWLLNSPEVRLVSTDGELASLARDRSRMLQVLPLAPIITAAQETWRLYVTMEWRSLRARRETAQIGRQKRGPKGKAARRAEP